MNVENTWNELSAEDLEQVTGGMMVLPHTRLENQLKALLSPNAGNLSDYVDPFGPEGRRPYIG